MTDPKVAWNEACALRLVLASIRFVKDADAARQAMQSVFDDIDCQASAEYVMRTLAMRCAMEITESVGGRKKAARRLEELLTYHLDDAAR
jgi:hypothetical protein